MRRASGSSDDRWHLVTWKVREHLLEDSNNDELSAACSVVPSNDARQSAVIPRPITDLDVDRPTPTSTLPAKGPHHVAVDERRATRWLVAITVSFAMLLIGLIVAFPWPLFDPDESLFAVITQEMADTNQWIIPTYEGKPFLDRPAPYFWILRGSTFLFGERESSYRIPNLLFGMGTAVAAGLIASRLFGLLAGAAASFCLMTMTAVVAMSVSVGHDAALVFFSTTSVAVWLLGSRSSQSLIVRSCFVGLLACFLAAGILSKGLLGLVLPAMGIGSLLLITREKRHFVDLVLSFGIAAVLGAAWYVAVETKSPGYLRYFFFERHMLGFFTSTQRHGNQSRFVYVTALLVGGFPWIFLLVEPFARACRRGGIWGRARNVNTTTSVSILNTTTGVTIWMAAIFLFFFVASSANPTYLLPIFPPAAILIGHSLSRWIVKGRTEYRWSDGYLRELPLIMVAMTCWAIPVVLIWFQRPWVFPVLGCGIVLTAVSFARLFMSARVTGSLVNHGMSLRVAHLGIIGLLLGAILCFVIGDTLPDIARERSTRAVLDIVHKLPGASSSHIYWFNGVPPSATYYGSNLPMDPIYFHQMQSRPIGRTILITRRSRKEEVQSAPFAKSARWIDTNGRYQIMLSEGF